MGRSETVHVLLYSEKYGTEPRQTMLCAMSRIEVLQKARQLRRKWNLEPDSLVAQTKVGEKIIGGDSCRWDEFLASVPQPRLVKCAICNGHGHDSKGFYCPVCNGSGICRKGNEKRWAAWQVERMLADRIEDAALS